MLPGEELLSWNKLTTALVAVILATVIQIIRYRPRVDCPSLTYAETDANKELLSQTPSLKEGYRTPRWASNKHTQTVMFATWPAQNPCKSKQRVFEFEESEQIASRNGATIVVDWCQTPDMADDAPILLLTPGVIGHSSNVYTRRFAQYMIPNGFRVCVKNWRGIKTVLSTPFPEAWDEAAVYDLHAVVQHISAKYPKAPIVASGFSFGGLLIHMYLGSPHVWGGGGDRDSNGQSTTNTTCKIVGAVTFSSLFDTRASLKTFENSAWVYQWLNTMAIKRMMKQHVPMLAQRYGMDPNELASKLAAVRSIREYHDVITTRFAETPYPDTDTYITHVAGLLFDALPRHVTPSLCLIAEDDPICPPTANPELLAQAQRSPHIILAQTRTGGHCGWFGGEYAESWSDRVGVEFLTACLKLAKTETSTSTTTTSSA